MLHILLDDSLTLHDNVIGPFVRASLGFAAEDVVLGIPAKHLVEDGLMALLGLVILSVMLVVYHYGDRTFKKISIGHSVLLAALAFFGVVVDLIHAAIRYDPWFPGRGPTSRSLGILEDGGELVVSLILWFVVIWWSRARQPEKEAKAQPYAK